MSTRRTLRPRPVKLPSPPGVTPPLTLWSSVQANNTPASIQIFLPGQKKLPGLSAEELQLLRNKQRELLKNCLVLVEHEALKLRSAKEKDENGYTSPRLETALHASFVFAQGEAGSAVCIAPEGWLLTCAHCFGETEEELRQMQTSSTKRHRWLLSDRGDPVRAECMAWDAKRDLALLRIVSIEGLFHDSDLRFPFVPLSTRPPRTGTPIVCFGQPAVDDYSGPWTRGTVYEYNPLEISVGRFRGMVSSSASSVPHGEDLHDNSVIGQLKHDAWTEWGHSGGALVRQDDGTLIGVHSSWDEDTWMRHGVPGVAIQSFLRQERQKMREKGLMMGGDFGDEEIVIVLDD